MRVVVTGGAGFIGSNLADALAGAGPRRRGASTTSAPATRRFLARRAATTPRCSRWSSSTCSRRTPACRGSSRAPTPSSTSPPTPTSASAGSARRRDLEQNVVATHNVLEAMRRTGVRRVPLLLDGLGLRRGPGHPDARGLPVPGADLALRRVEGWPPRAYLGAYAEGAGLSATVFRFVSILGPRYTHGHVIDFVRASCAATPTTLEILGDGRQRKSYLDVDRLRRRGARHACGRAPRFEVFNLGVDDYCTVRDSAGWICDRLGVDPDARSTPAATAGWVGDNPFIFLDTARIRATGWAPRHTSGGGRAHRRLPPGQPELVDASRSRA